MDILRVDLPEKSMCQKVISLIDELHSLIHSPDKFQNISPEHQCICIGTEIDHKAQELAALTKQVHDIVIPK